MDDEGPCSAFTRPDPDDHDHCDHDPIECTYDALVGEHREAVAENARLRAVVDAREDERNRLRERLDDERRHRVAAIDRKVETAAERDRLRAVVEAVRELMNESGVWDAAELGADSYNRLLATLAALDAGGEATDG